MEARNWLGRARQVQFQLLGFLYFASDWSGYFEFFSFRRRTNTFLARYRRLTRRRGKKKAIVAVGRSMLVIIWHLLADPDTRFHELGADHYDRHVNTHAK